MNRAVYIETYGCQMNVLDSELVAGQLEAVGYRIVDAPAAADVILINTCSVRDLAEHKVWSHLGRLGLEKTEGRSNLIIGVIGCMAEREAKAIEKRAPQVEVVCSPSRLDQLPMLLENAIENHQFQSAVAGHAQRSGTASGDFADDLEALDSARSFTRAATSAQAFVRITRGCNKLCSFCVVPFTRGPEVHRPPQLIIDEAKRLVDAGVVEVTLLGQTVNHYAYRAGEATTSFAELLWRVHEEIPGIQRLRFVTSFPRDFDDETLDVMARSSRICRYLHLPVQSGSNRMLQLMNRGHTIETYVELLARARRMMPDICFAGDMIVGFPGETEADHAASMELLRVAQYKSCFVFKYSPRSGTVAHRRYEDDIADEIKKKRNLELLAIQSDISLAHNRSKMGQTFEVLVEGQSKLRAHANSDLVQIGGAVSNDVGERVRLVSRTRGDEIVAFDGDAALVGRSVRVRGVDATPLTILARLES